MGKASIKNDHDAELASGILPSDPYGGRLGYGKCFNGPKGGTAFAQPLQEEDKNRSSQCKAHDLEDDEDAHKTPTQAQVRLAWRCVRSSLEALRQASMDALDAVDQASLVAGLGADVILEAIRLEHIDWDAYLDRMQRVHDMLDASQSETRIDMLILVDDPIASKRDLEKLDEDKGYLAYTVGRAFRDCPYRPDDSRSSDWQLGWLTARDEESEDDGRE